jgi:hypothetical protein
MKLASHNSWSYLPPTKWWMRLFSFVAKCQAKNIREQYEDGVRLFDLRIRFDEYGNLILAHGLTEYDAIGLESDLRWLNNQLDVVHVQVVLEIVNHDGWQGLIFSDWCMKVQRRYKNIVFLGFNRKYDWKPLIDDKHKDLPIAGCFASAPSDKWYSKINDLWPWLWAKRHNKEVIEAYKDYEGWVMMDFI